MCNLLDDVPFPTVRVPKLNIRFAKIKLTWEKMKPLSDLFGNAAVKRVAD